MLSEQQGPCSLRLLSWGRRSHCPQQAKLLMCLQRLCHRSALPLWGKHTLKFICTLLPASHTTVLLQSAPSGMHGLLQRAAQVQQLQKFVGAIAERLQSEFEK